MVDQKQVRFMKAYASCHEPFIRYCSALAYGKMDTEDLVQDVLLSAYQHFDRIAKKDQLLHYLIRAARNRSVSHWRKRKFKTEWVEKHQDKLASQGITPELQLDIDLLYRQLNRLPGHQRDALILYEISGFSMKEIASMQNSSVGAVKTKISRGRKLLRQLMEEKGQGRPLANLLKTVQSISL